MATAKWTECRPSGRAGSRVSFLKLPDEVTATRTPVITKRGRPVAQLVPYVAPDRVGSLAGSILRETGDPYGTGERWDADQDAGGS